MSMQEEHITQQRLKNAQKFMGDVFKSGLNFFKAVRVELNKDKSKLKIHQQGKANQLKKGLNIFQSIPQISKGLEISTQAIKPEQGLEITQAAPLREKAQTLIQEGKENIQKAATQLAGAVNSLTEPAKPNQTLGQGFAEMPTTIDADEKRSAPSAPEPEKVKDRLLFADGQLQPGITKQDMLAITELFTSKKGEMLQGDAAKGLTVEYDGQLLLKTDRDGRVETNNLQNQDLMANFDFRAKNDIADFQAQAEQLNPQLKEAIQAEVQDLAKLKSQVEERLVSSPQNAQSSLQSTPSVEEFNSPPAQQVHQDLESKRLDAPQAQIPQQPTPAIDKSNSPVTQQANQDLESKPLDAQQIQTPQQSTPQMSGNAKTLDRLVRGMANAFNANYTGKYPSQGRIQTPTGSVIEKTITDEKTKSFDLAIEKDGQKHQIASCKNGQFTIKEGMNAALPEIQQIAQYLGGYGKFETPTIVPRTEPDREQQTQEQKTPDLQPQESHGR